MHAKEKVFRFLTQAVREKNIFVFLVIVLLKTGLITMAKSSGKIIIVDDNENILKSLSLLLKKDFGQVELVKNPESLPGILSSNDFDVFLLDMNFRAGIHTGNEGIFWLREILKSDPDAVVILITAYGDIELAVKAMKEGALDFIQKPWDPEKLIATLKAAVKLRHSRSEVKRLQNRQWALNENYNATPDRIIGSSLVMKKIFDVIGKVAQTDANILVLGENGTGKEIIAREIHRKSKRSRESFVSVDIASVSDNLFESELFGHARGAFTDAKEDRMGRFESASGGTLFLDEIGNVPLNMQAKILSVLQNREITRLGSPKSIPIDIRLISATNKPVKELIGQGLFREDLFFRINTIEIVLPPLRHRDRDILLLADHFLKMYRRKYEKPDLELTDEACDSLMQHNWPGNIRELKHTIEKAVILDDNGVLTAASFGFGLASGTGGANFSSYKLEDVERNLIETVIHYHGGNMSRVAKELNISRTTLYSKINKYGL